MLSRTAALAIVGENASSTRLSSISSPVSGRSNSKLCWDSIRSNTSRHWRTFSRYRWRCSRVYPTPATSSPMNAPNHDRGWSATAHQPACRPPRLPGTVGPAKYSPRVRLLHTSDWHLGRSFHRVGMLEHQAVFIDHLVEVVRSEAVDVVVVAGDVYDRALPSVDTV